MIAILAFIAILGVVFYFYTSKKSTRATSAYSRSDVIEEYTAMIYATGDQTVDINEVGTAEKYKKIIKEEMKRAIDRFFQIVDARYVNLNDAEYTDFVKTLSLPKNAEIWDVKIVLIGLSFSIRTVYYPGMFETLKPPAEYKQWEEKLGGKEPIGCSNFKRSQKFIHQPKGSFECDKCLMNAYKVDSSGSASFQSVTDPCQEYLFNKLRGPIKYALDRFISIYPADEPQEPLEMAKQLQASGILDVSYSEFMTQMENGFQDYLIPKSS